MAAIAFTAAVNREPVSQGAGSMRGGLAAQGPALDRDAATVYVLGRQTLAGGFCFYRTPEWNVDEPNAPDTLAALESLRLLGCDPPAADLTATWLRSLQREDGFFPTLPIGWAALRSLELLGLGPARSPRGWVGGWTERLLTGSATREWPEALRGLLQLVELLPLAGLELDAEQRLALARLVEVARLPDSGWTRAGVDLESTAVAVRVLELSHLPLERPEAVRQVVESCEDSVLGLRVTADAGATSAAALAAGVELSGTLGIRLRHPTAVASSIALLQRRDGGLGARHRAISTLHDTWLGLRAEQLLHNPQEARP